MEHTIIVFPHDPSRGTYKAYLESSPDKLLCISSEPLLAGARALLKRGLASPTDQIKMRHQGSNIVALFATVDAAAKLTVQEATDRTPRFVRFRSLVEGASKIRPARQPGIQAASRAKIEPATTPQPLA